MSPSVEIAITGASVKVEANEMDAATLGRHAMKLLKEAAAIEQGRIDREVIGFNRKPSG